MQQGNYPAERTGSLKTTMLQGYDIQGYQYYGGGNGSGYRGRPGITLALSKMLEKHIDPHNDSRIYWAKEVTFDYSTSHSIRVDYMRFKPINNSISGIGEKAMKVEWRKDIEYTVRCFRCGETESIYASDSEYKWSDTPSKYFVRQGWRMVNDETLCPNCVEVDQSDQKGEP